LRWTWNPGNAAANRAKRGLSFDTAAFVFDDPLHASKPDPHPDGDRWCTLGQVGSVVLLVVHTWPEARSGDEGADRQDHQRRKATARERKAYEEGDF